MPDLLMELRDSTQTEHSQKGFVDSPQLFGRDVTDESAQPTGIDGTYLLDQHTRGLAGDVDLRPERGRAGASGSRRYEDHRTREQLVSLHDDPESTSLLFAPAGTWRTELEDVTAKHAWSPSRLQRHAFLADPPRQLPAQRPLRQGHVGVGASRRPR